MVSTFLKSLLDLVKITLNALLGIFSICTCKNDIFFLLSLCWSCDLHGIFHQGKSPLVLLWLHSLSTQSSLVVSWPPKAPTPVFGIPASVFSSSIRVPSLRVADSTDHWQTNSWCSILVHQGYFMPFFPTPSPDSLNFSSQISLSLSLSLLFFILHYHCHFKTD